MEEELKQHKSVLRSLVVSSATQVDVRTLLRDYRTMVGKHLPYAKFGYKEPVTFLKEHFSDCFLFQGPISNPVLMLIVPDSLKHIDKFVQKQKVNNLKLKGKRRSVHEKTVKPVYSETNLITQTFVNRDIISKAATQIKNGKLNLQNDKENEHTQSLLEPPSPVKENKEPNDIIKENGACAQNALQNFLKKRTPLYNSELSVSDKDPTIEYGNSERLTSSSTSSKRIQMEELHREIREIIMENPNGVWCTDLLRLYRARYNRELNFSRLGYTSVLSAASALDGVLVSRRGLADDWLLSDAARPPPPAARPACRPLARRAPPAPADPDDALPGIEFEPDVFPADCVHFLESIPAVSLADVSPGDMLEVAVAEVYSPSHFWLLRLGEEYDIAAEDTMDDMNEYYERGEGRDRRLAPGALRPGHYCASLYDGDWHRAIIVRIVDADAVKTSECHLYPRFEALESGAAPSFAEVHAYLRDGIALDFVHDYRLHVPPCLPPSPPSPPSPPALAISESTGTPPSPPPPPPVPGAPRTVSLSATDCETFALLSRLDASAAQRFMLQTLSRALADGPSAVRGPSAVGGPSPVRGPFPVTGRSSVAGPEAAEFRSMRPPPGFESDYGDGS